MKAHTKSVYFFLASLIVLAIYGCANKPELVKEPLIKEAPQAEDLSYAETAIAIPISDSLSIRPSWTYFMYAMQAMDNQEWLLAKHYLDESLRQLISEKYDSTYMNVSKTEDSLYRNAMPLRIVWALDEVYPNIVDLGEDAETFKQKEISIEGVDALDENSADSTSLKIIESFLDTLDKSQFTLPIEFNERVLQEIFYMTHAAREFTASSLNRKTAYDSLIYSQLDSAKMPRDLIYLALVESGFKTKAYSRAKASGMWQFIPETGKRYGLAVDYWVDMRRTPELATAAALKYLKRLYDEFGDWLLAMAAYNCGEGRVRRLVKEAALDTLRDTSKAITYWELQLPKETMRYVPRILAAMVVGHYPEQYDMQIKTESLMEFDTVTVFDSFSLEEVAKLLNVAEDTLRTLNMELIKWCTPPNKDSYVLRLPVGTREIFVNGYDTMKKNDFSGWQRHKVRKGENMGGIARQYGIKLSELQLANNMKSTRIRAGQTLLIPIKVSKKKSTGKKPENIRLYIVKKGDDLAIISRKFGISKQNLQEWNSLDSTSNVIVGDTLKVSLPKHETTTVTAKLENSQKPYSKKVNTSTYVVQSGDTYANIAKTLDVPVVMLLNQNSGFYKRLTVGDTLIVPKILQNKNTAKAEKKKQLPKEQIANSVYVVQPGDNLTIIAAKFSTTVSKIQAINNMGNSTNLNIGQKLKIAIAEQKVHVVQKGEGLWDIARKYNVTIEEIVKWNSLLDTKIKIGERLKIMQR